MYYSYLMLSVKIHKWSINKIFIYNDKKYIVVAFINRLVY